MKMITLRLVACVTMFVFANVAYSGDYVGLVKDAWGPHLEKTTLCTSDEVKDGNRATGVVWSGGHGMWMYYADRERGKDDFRNEVDVLR